MYSVYGINMNQIEDTRSPVRAAVAEQERRRRDVRLMRCFPLLLLMLFRLAPGIAADYLLGPGDVVSINVYDYPELLTETRVSDSGSITFPLIGEVSVGGKSPAEVEKLITSALSSGGFIKHAQVHVKVQEFVSQKVSVIGEVKAPGKYSTQEASRVTEAIALAGGINPDTGGDKAYLTRQADPAKKIEIDLHALLHADARHDLPVQGGDIIFVPKAARFYIYGQVNNPGHYKLERNMTVQQAISVGGGLTPKGTESGLEIRRTQPNGEQVTIEVEPNDAVQPDDVLFVEESWF